MKTRARLNANLRELADGDPSDMNDLAQAAETVASLMRLLTTTGGFRWKFRITAGAGAIDPDKLERRDIYVECKGSDADLLLEHDGELLRALEHIAAKMLKLEPEDHDRVSFDADGYKHERAQAMRSSADAAIRSVEESGKPYSFATMSSRERRMLHLLLRDSGLQTASSGEGSRRFVVLYPAGYRIPPERPSGFSGGIRPPQGRDGRPPRDRSRSLRG